MDGKLPLDEKPFGVCGALAAFRCHMRHFLPLVAHVIKRIFFAPCKRVHKRGDVFFMKKTVVLVYMSLFIAMNVILTHVIPVLQVETLRISFGFVPVAISSMIFGPVAGGIGAAVADIIGMIVSPRGNYYAGFTLSAFLTGAVYGLFLFRKPKTTFRIALAVSCVTLFVDIALNTLWLKYLLGQGYFAMLPARVIKSLIMLPVQVVIIQIVWKYLGIHIKNISAKNFN